MLFSQNPDKSLGNFQMVFYRQVFNFDIDDLRDRVAVFRVRAISEDPLLPSITPNISIFPIRIK